MLFEKLSYEKPLIIVEFDLIVSACTSCGVTGNAYPDMDDPLNYESLGLGDPFELAH